MRWPGFKHIFFDCDSTLTAVEGIDVLAQLTGNEEAIAALTQAAMDGKVGLEEIYEQRLRQTNPTRQQVRDIYRIYRRNVVEDARQVIEALHALGISTYIISGGLEDAVVEFGVHLGISRKNIRAVGVSYDQLAGAWWENRYRDSRSNVSDRYLDYAAGDLTVSDGKGEVIRALLDGQQGRSLLVGDGYSDLRAGSSVDLFVGFGGVVEREIVLAEAAAYVHSKSLTPLLALAAGPAALMSLMNSKHEKTVAKAFTTIRKGAITFRDDRLKDRFSRALTAALNPPY